MNSIWQEEIKLKERERLQGSHHTKVVILGAGMAGILTSYLLKEAGIPSIILEAGRIAAGQTGGTTAKITSQHGLLYGYLLEKFGEEKAKQYATANEQAIPLYEKIVQKKQMDCDFIRCPSYLYTADSAESISNVEKLKKEAGDACSLGIEAEFTTDTELPFSVEGAVVFKEQARFHPLKFIRGIVDELEIYENSRVTNLEGNCAYTEHGLVEAEHVVFAAHYPYLITQGYYFIRMHQSRSYALALKGAKQLHGMYRDMEESGLSLRSNGDVLILGGGSHRTGENHSGGKYESLRKQAGGFYPESQEIACWSAQDCMSMDRIPYIGLLAAAIPNWYVATGFGKWGMTTSMAAAVILRDMIKGEVNGNEEVFSPQRFHLSASAKALADNGIQAVKGLSSRVFSFPDEKAAKLPIGHGGIVEYEGKKVGVYKDLEGHIFTVSIKCPHMGCQLEWNPDERSWDCPCHGSRFNYRGELLNDPAQVNLGNV